MPVPITIFKMKLIEIELGPDSLFARLTTERLRSEGMTVELVTFDASSGGASDHFDRNTLLVREEDAAEVRSFLEAAQ